MDHPSPRITGRDRLLLEFIAEHRLVLSNHVQALLGVSAQTASRRLRALEQAGLVDRETLFYRYPAHYRIRRRGLELIGSRLGVPKRGLNVAHDVGVAWLWLAARRGAFGSLAAVVSERTMRSRDGAEAHASRVTGRSGQEPFGVRLAGRGPRGRPRLHYPDLLLVDREGRRIAVELELSSKGRSRRHQIIGGYASDRRIDAVLYLVNDQRIAREVQEAARRFGAERTVIVQRVRIGAGQLPPLGAVSSRDGARDTGRDATAERTRVTRHATRTQELAL
jgi:DNA-binding transcriptional ArsR family regulator